MDSQEPPEVVRRRLIARFERWLDEALEEGSPPDGLAAELLEEAESEAGAERPDGRTDLHAMWAAVTALSQEVRLQGRAFKQLAETLEPVAGLAPLVEESVGEHREAIAMTQRVMTASRDSERSELRAAERKGQRPLIDVLTDLRERLSRGLAPVQSFLKKGAAAPPAGWLGRLFGAGGAPEAPAAVAALEEGSRLCLERLEETLGRLGVHEIECVGRRFDPHTMTAMEVSQTGDPDRDGQVLEVYRPGYAWAGELLRPAQVRVGRLKS